MNAKTKNVLVSLLCLFMFVGLLSATSYAATKISSIAITNLATPKAGATPATSPTVTTQGVKIYSVDWYDETSGKFLESGDKFIQNHIYKVQIWAEAKSGYEFAYTDSHTPNVSATIMGKTATVSKAYEYNAWAMVVVSYTFPACPMNSIQSLEIKLPGVTKKGNVLLVEENSTIPNELMSASEDISLYPELNINRYYPDGFRWNNLTKDVLTYSGERFKGGCDYYVTIAIKPNDGSTFADSMVVNVNGKQATLKAKGASYAEVGIELTCYGTIGGNDIRPVVILPKDGNAPDMGATYADPQCKHIDYAYVCSWQEVESGKKLSSDDTFIGGKQYRVELCLMAAYAYKFDRDASDKMKYSPQITGVDVDSYYFGYDDYRGRELIYISKTFTAITPDHKCTSGAWQCDASGHKNYCTICKRTLAGGAHWGGTETCASGKKCEVCGYEYTKPTEKHTPDTTKWTACGNLYHAHLCKVCGAHCDQQDHTPGPEATDDTPQKCTVCNYVITPAKNHKHTIKEVAATEPTCTHTGNSKYYLCTGCEQMFEDKDGKTQLADSFMLPALGHSASDKWNYDEQYHWHTCLNCEELLPETKESHIMENGKCTACSYDGSKLNNTPSDSTDSTDWGKDDKSVKSSSTDKQNKKKESGYIIWIILGTLLVGIAGVVITIVVRKKKI